MALFGGKKTTTSTTQNINETLTRQSNQQDIEGLAVSGDNINLTVQEQSIDALRATERAVEDALRSNERAFGEAAGLGGSALDAITRTTGDAFGFGEASLRTVGAQSEDALKFGSDALESIERIAERSLTRNADIVEATNRNFSQFASIAASPDATITQNQNKLFAMALGALALGALILRPG